MGAPGDSDPACKDSSSPLLSYTFWGCVCSKSPEIPNYSHIMIQNEWETSVREGTAAGQIHAARRERRSRKRHCSRVSHYLLSFQRLVDGQVAVAVHGEDDDLPSVVEPGCSRDVEPLACSGHNRGDGVTCGAGVG